MRTKIISAFPGTGKSHYHKLHPDTTLDSDSSQFSWIEINGNKTRNPEFPNNYIQHIKDNIGKYKYIFVSSHKEVRNALIDNCLKFYIVVPKFSCKEIYLDRYRQRGNDDYFINLIDRFWDLWLHEIDTEFGCHSGTVYRLNKFEYIDIFVSYRESLDERIEKSLIELKKAYG